MADEQDTIEEVKPEVVPAGLEYDMPPKEFVAGTVVPKDTLPEDMTDAEYVQWMYENHTPFWAIRKNILLRKAPVLSGMEPSTAAIGDPSFDIVISGVGLCPDSVIVFNGHDEPTAWHTNDTVSTGVNMGVWHGAAVLPVCVRNADKVSEPLEFTFTGGEPVAEPEADFEEVDEGLGDDGVPAKRKIRRKKK